MPFGTSVITHIHKAEHSSPGTDKKKALYQTGSEAAVHKAAASQLMQTFHPVPEMTGGRHLGESLHHSHVLTHSRC